MKHIEHRWAVACRYIDSHDDELWLAGRSFVPRHRRRSDADADDAYATSPKVTTYRTLADARKAAKRIRLAGLRSAVPVRVRLRIEVLS